MHRDISTGNILVYSRDYDGIFIKFADFGLAKEGEQLTTHCGHRTYLAPEIHRKWCKVPRSAASYTSAVDIWSAGVVITELLCGLPNNTTVPIGTTTSVRASGNTIPIPETSWRHFC
ncbi:hypothetical protein MFIFM68171_02310 [Madurella fahalii]|uniref:Protein kinase domain-containing protein n=1 Tax=Madurella fahalii TaxID=1157608 RepID=A0ABQ0G2Y2_9PEZI